MSQPLVRRAKKQDIATIVSFNQAMANETENISLKSSILIPGVEALFNDQKLGFYIVCEVDKSVRACLMISYEWSDWRNGLFWWIQSVFVQKEYRKQGLYKLMYQYIKTLVDGRDDIVGIRLYVDDENKNAKNVYKKLGMHKSNYELFEYNKPKRDKKRS